MRLSIAVKNSKGSKAIKVPLELEEEVRDLINRWKFEQISNELKGEDSVNA